ncbi:LNS2-domain-containing protein [Mycena polygramma]|nr:LNS2-domain-containing protein [Mycena polygramma]
MNYIRGAVNAISAPYQYYRDLPPINPSTLTGAIDVIVVQRPTSNGATELVCSPFHVRFGKWQVLRPGEKKVKVSVNGHAIPFDMKIGEAGEAFFVFETDDDVPEDLITSPILQPTRPDEGKDIPTDRFGARQDRGEPENRVHPADAAETPEATDTPVDEPEFLDLNAGSNSPSTSSLIRPSHSKRPSSLSLSSTGRESPSPMSMEETQDERVDRALKVVQESMAAHEVLYKPDIALDAEGYHSRSKHDRDRTITEDDDGTYRSPTPSPTSRSHPDQKPRMSSLPKLDVEYSWEWGAFPQPSPMKASFGMGGRADGGIGGGKDVAATWGRTSRAKAKRMGELDMGVDLRDMPEEEEDAEPAAGGSGSGVRSRSVPPALDGSPSRARRRRPVSDRYEDDEIEGGQLTDSPSVAPEVFGFGAGGRLSVSQSDPTKFTVAIEGKKVGFELSLVSDAASDDQEGESEVRGRRDRNGSSGGTRVFDRRDEVEAARLFGKDQIDLHRFLEDETVVNDPRLVIRWAGDHYITRSDGSPLMDALVLWRDALVRQTTDGIPLRPTSPASDEDDTKSAPDSPIEEEEPERRLERSKSEPPEPTPTAAGKPTSSSWVQWWSRSKREGTPATKEDRPPLPWSASAPNASDTQLPLRSSGIPPADSAPSPSTPIQRPSQALLNPNPSPESVGKRKFAKTLRLTSDQLKSLNLKPGPNSITFSLSTSGTIACTARIFVWDSTDLVLVSDIDGTITKSDGLGHVFAMIGRDWTHLGVAKLYTDITRNGYKIMYLTSRAIGQADATRDYLKGIKQNDYQLPEGPVIMSPDRLMASLHREVIMRKPEVFKMACLRDIQRLFGEASRNPFYAGFGNRITDALSYRSVNVPSSRIFTIDSSGEVKLELLELAGYKSSYIHMTDLVDQMFPPIHRKWAPEYTDFNYWKPPVQDFALPDLSPPSPALSARSDTSGTFARIRNFSLVSGRQGSHMRQAALNKVNGSASRETSPPPDEQQRSAELRQMSSFERLSNTLSSSWGKSSPLTDGSRRSVSPESRSSSSYTYADSDEEDGEDDLETDKQRRRRQRHSMTSMPGSLDDDLQFVMDDDEPAHDDESHDPIEDEEEAFDEDLLAAGEMKNVPFL